MRRHRVGVIALAMFASAMFAVTACYGQHGQPRESLKIGDKAVEWGSLPATDGKSYSLADIDAKLVAVVFGCHHCPVHVAYEDRLKEIQADYKDKGVAVVVINPNALWGDEQLDRMKKRAEEKEYNFPYINDQSQESGHKWGGRVTPHVFLIDQDRKVRYIGGVDDSQNPANVKEKHLRNALDALLKGEEPPQTETRAFGCTIKYK
jgi:peroxiredoxin